MFGCCNNLFSTGCRCNRCNRCNQCSGNNGSGFLPTPIPIFPPLTPVTPQPRQLRGLQIALNGSSGGSIASGATVPFNTLVADTISDAAFVPANGTITLGRAGSYLVNWWVGMGGISLSPEDEPESTSVSGDGNNDVAPAFGVALNGSTVSTAYAGAGAGQIFGTAIVNVTSVPSTLSLVNLSGSSVTYATAAGQAGLTVTALE